MTGRFLRLRAKLDRKLQGRNFTVEKNLLIGEEGIVNYLCFLFYFIFVYFYLLTSLSL